MQLVPPLAAYPYVQYNDDDDISAFFMAYNSMAQEYVDFFNDYNLGDFRSPLLTGRLLDWCALGIYDMSRPYLVTGHTSPQLGPYGTLIYGLYPYAFISTEVPQPASYSYVSDEIFRRVLTWNFFKGDGTTFNVNWLKRRIIRFLNGDDFPQDTYDVSIEFPSGNNVDVNIPASNPFSATLLALFTSNIVQLPFQYSFTVSLV